MLRNFLLSLENDNHPLLSPTLWGLQKWGLWQPNKVLNSNISNFIHFAATLFVISQYVELWLIRDNLNYALRNLSVTMLSTVCVVKAFTFVTWQDQWKDVIDNVSLLEKRQLSKKDKITDKIISEYTNYARRVTNFYWTLVAATVFTVILAPLVCFLSSPDTRERIRDGYEPYPEIMSSWVPFDRSRGLGYWVTVLEHILICFYGGGIVATYDSNAVVLITFFAGQMKLLSVNCSRLFDDEKEMTYEDDMEKIRACHYHHLMLIKYSKILNSLLSPVMFLYVIICSLMICASGIQLTTEGTTTMQRIWIAEYLMALIAQLFLYCWHSNEALVMSKDVDQGVYESDWWKANPRMRKQVLLLAGKLNRPILYTAGPFSRLTVPTFISIIKGSYSFFTLFAQMQEEN